MLKGEIWDDSMMIHDIFFSSISRKRLMNCAVSKGKRESYGDLMKPV